MKKLLCLSAVLALLLTGCGARQPAPEEITEATTQAETQPQAEVPEEGLAVLTLPLDYEILSGLAKTPTHYYAPYDGGILRTPIDNLALAEKIPLPGSYHGLRLSGAEICGITQDWLFVNLWEARAKKRDTYGDGPDDYYEYEDYENRTCVTYRIAMESWEAEEIAANKYNERRPLPWYNAAGDSLLIPSVTEGYFAIEAMPLASRKCVPVVLGNQPISYYNSYWRNAIDGRAVLVDPCSDHEEECHYYVFDKKNQVHLVGYDDVNLPARYEWNYDAIAEYDWLLPEFDDEQGNAGYGLFLCDDKVMLVFFQIYAPSTFQFLYDPATGAQFPPKEA
ncbi:MAG: hypothetical protein FWC27_14995 [Firmicutes bacterium]|nr:hypothetical protein [Bacillota bacterium]